MAKPPYQIWKKLSTKVIKQRIQECLHRNIDFKAQSILGIPVSSLDENVFSQDERLLESSVFLQTMVDNPNHIGCHTLGESEPFFSGTQELEREAVEIVACDILGGKLGEQDGYIAAGGTEANLQAMWIFRNYFRKESEADNSQIAILCSSDSHYSMAKGANLLDLRLIQVTVDDSTREIKKAELEERIKQAQQEGIRCFIVVSNLMTTMFGSVDDVDLYAECLTAAGAEFKIHIDAAYGGFIYPFSSTDNRITFANPNITSFTLDAHKLLQAPFGTGMFVIRKNWMQYATTDKAQYVQGMDSTLSGSRSGANAIAVWMILVTYGPHGWYEKILLLNHRTEWLSNQLSELGIKHYRHSASNIVTIRASQLAQPVIERYFLVPDSHVAPAWYKIVVMNHVTVDVLELFIEELKSRT
ncbi:MAG: pyridoxal-dependent decarboxylase [Gammaproteobacteria bacterium]|nr:pyridoxal-dependent decarboxylase [Gammaproteobacteria bacterium]